MGWREGGRWFVLSFVPPFYVGRVGSGDEPDGISLSFGGQTPVPGVPTYRLLRSNPSIVQGIGVRNSLLLNP
jgi:hypothetical protein